MTAPGANWRALRDTGGPTPILVDGRRYELPPIPAALLLEHLAAGQPGAVIPGQLPPAQLADWTARLLDDTSPFDIGDATAITEAVIEHLCGVPVHTAVALAAWCQREWLLADGWHLTHGVDLLALPPRRLFACLYAFLATHRFETVAQADTELFTPPPPPPPPEAAQPAGRVLTAAGRDFMAATAAISAAQDGHR